MGQERQLIKTFAQRERSMHFVNKALAYAHEINRPMVLTLGPVLALAPVAQSSAL